MNTIKLKEKIGTKRFYEMMKWAYNLTPESGANITTWNGAFNYVKFCSYSVI